MRAAIFTGERAIEARDVPELPPQRGEVLVEVARAGICGSDLHVYFGRWGQPAAAPGHELSGRIVAVGAGVAGWRVGDRVTAECYDHCGDCPACRAGRQNHCENSRWGSGSGHGAMSQRATLYASALCSIDGLTDEQGALVEPLAVGLHAAARLGQVEGKAVAVIGAGTIGLTSALAARALGAGRVVVFARYPHQAAMAKRLGIADARIEPPGDDETFPLVIDSVGSGQSLAQSAARVARLGRIVEVGCMTQAEEVNLAALFGKEAELTGSSTYGHSGGRRDFERAVEWLREGAVDPTPMITHRFGLDEVAEAFRVAADKKTGAVKVMLLPNGG